MSIKSKSVVTGVLMAAFLLAAGGAAALSVSGSTTVLPFGVQCAEEFNAAQSAVQVSVTGGGSGVGIKNVAEGISDVAMASRPVKDSEKEAYPDEEFVEILVAYDAVCIAVSQAVYDAGVTELSAEEVRAIYNGEITSWAQLGGDDEEIYVLGREVGSGTRDTFNEMVMGSDKAETPGVTTSHGSNAEVKTAITSSDSAIGYLGLNYVLDGDLGVIAYEGVEPSSETVKDMSYPLARELYMVTYGESSEESQAFLDFVTGEDGQAIAEELGFVSIT
ncbi:MAG: phosphate ABC transporter substrate-binding protein [Methanothrix sp.]|jgi:phosphate transport system substrate-binding protein|nr:phosphate ABC transporter substrate-binding protein [Methanothrix sp.]OPX82651.1 MAG: PBP superfamily domain protein [Methanosaeta sp. PtaB.Bin087]NLX39812.1 phosphate ABC transporter substrate-binding protein [Methanothrix sp.]HOI68954.1 phosphate ABC transporter substrate-binding protein [Methanothrix sp.]HPY72181.1 phosphate ABC transporter substrate-binding protein [Methanothrix sp.]